MVSDKDRLNTNLLNKFGRIWGQALKFKRQTWKENTRKEIKCMNHSPHQNNTGLKNFR